MIRSRSRLVVSTDNGRSAVTTARAEAPQRWSTRYSRETRAVDATHQVLGDGFFGGERYETAITAGEGAIAVVRGMAATPLRTDQPSASVVRIRVSAGATVLYLPGPLIPQAGSDHISALRIDAHEEARVLVAAIVTGGRTGMGEYGVFGRLRSRLVVSVGGRLALAEDSTLEPARTPLEGRAMFAGADCVLSVVAAGRWPAATAAWWEQFAFEGLTGAAQPLAHGGMGFRALCSTLGDAQRAVSVLERAALLPG